MAGGERTLTAMFDARVETNPADPLVRFVSGREYSAGQLDGLVRRTSGALAGLGVQAGDRVALLCGNRIEFLVGFLGASSLGAIPVPLNTALRGVGLQHVIAQSDPVVVITESEHAERLRDAAAVSGSQARLVLVGEHDQGDQPRMGDLLKAATPRSPIRPAEHDPAFIAFTSGTTGGAKGVVWSHRMAVRASIKASQFLDYRTGDVSFSCLPLFHVNACIVTMFASVLANAEAVFAERFNPREFWSTVRDTGATILSLIGSMGPILLRQDTREEERSHSVRIALVVPSSSLEHRRALESRFGFEVTEVYGSTEVAAPLTVPIDRLRDRPDGACGRSDADFDCELVDDNAEPVPPGEVGELAVRPLQPFIMYSGYWSRDKVSAAHQQDHWFRTGDLFRRDEEGWLYFIDRAKDVIRRSGENISPSEVEMVISGHPAVAEAAVFGVPSELAEEDVMAAIVLKDDATFSCDELVTYCEARLARFAVPRYIEVLEYLPRTETQKVQKAVLRKRGITPNTFDRGRRSTTARRP